MSTVVRVIHAIASSFKRGADHSLVNEKFTDALVEAIGEAGQALASHFPRTSTSSGQLPDEVIER